MMKENVTSLKVQARLAKVKISDVDLANRKFMSRMEFDDDHIVNLADDMRRFGQRNPIGLRRRNENYQIIYGWCRVKAALLMGWKTIEARIYVGLSDLQAQLHNVSDNATHENLSPLEIAYQVKKLREEFGVSVKEIAKLYGNKTQFIYDSLTVTRMKEEIQQAIHRGEIGLTHAIEINKFQVSNQLEILAETIDEGLSTSNLKRLRSQSIPKVVTKVSSQLSEKELEEVAIKREYSRFQKFLLHQTGAEASSLEDRKAVAKDWISSLNALREAYGWKLPLITERINTLIFTILRARIQLEKESDVYRTPKEHLTNREMLTVAGLRQDKPSRLMLGWLIRESARYQALSCNHTWHTNKNRDHCNLCGISRYANQNWVDPPNEPPSTRVEARP